jgi:hypothetical protein
LCRCFYVIGRTAIFERLLGTAFDTFRFTVIRRNDGSIEIAPKGDPNGTRIFHKRAKRHESDLVAAHHRDGLDGLDRLCERLLAGWAEIEEST